MMVPIFRGRKLRGSDASREDAGVKVGVGEGLDSFQDRRIESQVVIK